MADTLSDSPMSGMAGMDRDQHSPSSNRKRNNRTRKQRATPSAVQSDGFVSDWPSNHAASPGSAKAQKARQGVATSAPPAQDVASVGITGSDSTVKQRPISLSGGPGAGTPLKEQAYAGPTFQASPAASALPMPKFFSKSVPSGIGKPSLQGRLAGEKSPEQQISSPEPDVVQPAGPPREMQQSPLDLFFKADRAEREQKRAVSNGSNPAFTRQTSHSHGHSIDVPSPSARSGKNIFLSELDGEPGEAQSHREGGSYQRPPVGPRVHSSPNFKVPSGNSDEERHAYTKSLKDLLFNTAAQQASTPPRQTHDRNGDSRTPESVYFTPSPFQRPSSGPATPQNASDQPNHYSLHYGNRNLSPLFKAARVETPPRPSSLRQEVPFDTSSTIASTNSVHSPPQHPMQTPPYYRNAQVSPYQPFAGADSRIHSQDHPAQQPRNATPARMPADAARPPSTSNRVPEPAAAPVNPRPGGPNDIRTMEDDLRRMLKLNTLS